MKTLTAEEEKDRLVMQPIEEWISIKIKPKRTALYLILTTWHDSNNNTDEMDRHIAMYIHTQDRWVFNSSEKIVGYCELPEYPKLPLKQTK